MCDDVLLEKFSYLNLRDLCAVAQSSVRFEGLAQTIFETSFAGRIDVCDEDIQRVFGPSTKHLILPWDATVLWDHFNVNQIKTLHISTSHFSKWKS